VGGKTAIACLPFSAGDLRLSIPQLKSWNRFSVLARGLMTGTRRTLERGWRVREILKQGQYKPLRASNK